MLVAWGVSLVVMIFEKDLGSALLFFVLFVMMLWVATGRGCRTWWSAVLLFAVGAVFTWTQFDHVQRAGRRVARPVAGPPGKRASRSSRPPTRWHGAGSTGTGLGLGIAGRIPYDETDFIFAIIGEELGLVGATAVLCAFVLIAGSGLRIARRATDSFGTLLAVGLTSAHRVPGLHHRGRRHPGAAAHRRDPAVRLLRRVVADVELHPVGVADQDLRPDRAPSRPTAVGPMNKQIKILAVAIMVCYSVLFLKLNQVQILDADKYNRRIDNTRRSSGTSTSRGATS